MKLRGVNLGGWLVLEHWMTPALFAGTDAIDEHTFLQTPGARAKLRRHHKTFITEEDFAWMQQQGINAVRIPVGYWILDGDAPYVSSIERLDWAFRMALKYDISVLLCLHGAPGSQNGHDHSGKVGKALWYRNRAHQQQTITILCRLAERYRDEPQFWGLELLNEPAFGIVQWKLRRFYRESTKELRALLQPSTRIVFHDAFTPRLMNAAVGGELRRMVMDIHWYHFAFYLHRWAPLPVYWRLITWHARLIRSLQHWQGIIIGEWSMVLSHEALARYPEQLHEGLMVSHLQRQLVAYKHADGWFYWTYKTEGRGVWHFRSLVEDGILPIGWLDS